MASRKPPPTPPPAIAHLRKIDAIACRVRQGCLEQSRGSSKRQSPQGYRDVRNERIRPCKAKGERNHYETAKAHQNEQPQPATNEKPDNPNTRKSC